MTEQGVTLFQSTGGAFSLPLIQLTTYLYDTKNSPSRGAILDTRLLTPPQITEPSLRQPILSTEQPHREPQEVVEDAPEKSIDFVYILPNTFGGRVAFRSKLLR